MLWESMSLTDLAASDEEVQDLSSCSDRLQIKQSVEEPMTEGSRWL